ncbi:hypothetical protein BKA57DRAFT_43860, partial [Linnemannia elongata]
EHFPHSTLPPYPQPPPSPFTSSSFSFQKKKQWLFKASPSLPRLRARPPAGPSLCRSTASRSSASTMPSQSASSCSWSPSSSLPRPLKVKGPLVGRIALPTTTLPIMSTTSPARSTVSETSQHQKSQGESVLVLLIMRVFCWNSGTEGKRNFNRMRAFVHVSRTNKCKSDEEGSTEVRIIPGNSLDREEEMNQEECLDTEGEKRDLVNGGRKEKWYESNLSFLGPQISECQVE